MRSAARVLKEAAGLRSGLFSPACPTPAASASMSVFKKFEEKVKEAKDGMEGKVNAEELKEKLRDSTDYASSLFKGVLQGVRGADTAAQNASSSAQPGSPGGAAGDENARASGAAGGPAAGAGGPGTDGQGAEGGQGRKYDTGKRKPESLVGRLSLMARQAYAEVAEAVLPRDDHGGASTLQAHRRGDTDEDSAPRASDIMVVQRRETRWERVFGRVREAATKNPLYERMSGVSNHPAFNKVREVREDLREKWETSDSALVHHIQNFSDNVFQETESGQALREIRARDPDFEMVAFLKGVQRDAPKVIKAYLGGEVAALEAFCSPEMLERLSGIIAALKQQGHVPDTTILHTSEVQLTEVKFLDAEPIAVVSFACQQINCVRDTYGNVVEGGTDEVHQVHYAWALQQEPHGAPDPSTGKWRPPRWQLREMLIRGSVPLL